MPEPADTALFHICSREAATTALAAGAYRAPSLDTEGFIHLSRAHQVPGTAAAFYAGVPHLVLLVIDPVSLGDALRYEPPAPPPGVTETADRHTELFPHAYSAIDAAAIVDVIELDTFDGTPVHADTMAMLRHQRFARLPVEGTLYRSTWRSTVENHAGEPAGTAMIGLYAASPRSVSCFHRLSHDEVWHAYAGDPFTLHLLHADGRGEAITMGTDPLAGHAIQHVVPAGTWQAGELVAGGRYALFGCTMAPGFTGSCFEAAHRTALLRSHPQAAAAIARLARGDGDDTRMPPGFAS